MWMVTTALRRPITVLVLVIAAILTGLFAIERMPPDVFPTLGVPVLYVAQPYGGMDPAQMEGFLVNYYEYHFLYITGIEHVESKSIQGVGLIKLQFHPGTDMAGAMAEIVNYVNRARAFMPTGTVPPFVMRFDAGSVPVGDLVFSDESGKLGVKALQDAALFRVRSVARLMDQPRPGLYLDAAAWIMVAARWLTWLRARCLLPAASPIIASTARPSSI
jgi:multidrug efflux pump subunit AcrB